MAAGICLTAFYNIYQGSLGAVSAMTNLMSVSLPVIFAVTAVSGGASSAAVLSAVVTAAVTAFSAWVRFILMPMVFVSGIFSVVSSVGKRSYIKKTAKFLRTAAVFGMGLSITLFTGLTAIQGIMTKSADDMLMRTARYSLDNLIPLVGRIYRGLSRDDHRLPQEYPGRDRRGRSHHISSSPDRSSCKIRVRGSHFRATSLVLEPAGDDAMSDCMGELASAATVMAALLFLSSLMFVIFFTCVLRFVPSL